MPLSWLRHWLRRQVLSLTEELTGSDSTAIDTCAWLTVKANYSFAADITVWDVKPVNVQGR